MKRLISLLLVFVLILSGCEIKKADKTSSITEVTVEENTETSTESQNSTEVNIAESFSGLDDEDLLRYVETDVYDKMITNFDSDEYFIENVSTVYLSKEYLEELEYNSQSNVYFGYSVSELDQAFKGKKYVFTLGDNNTTIVKEQEVIDEVSYNEMLKNVAIGTGVILICVTVSMVTAGSTPAVSVIFAASAKSATTFALSGTLISGITTGIVTGYTTGDFDAALDAGLMAGSEGYKWGAVTGAITGGTAKAFGLKSATLNGLTMNEAARIQRESKWPLEVIKSIHSTDEYDIYKKIGLNPTKLEDGSIILLQDIDWNLVDDAGRTNVDRVVKNLAPIDKAGESFELHHIGMKSDAPLAILSNEEHHSKENYRILHWAEEGKDIESSEWDKQRREFWKNVLEYDRQEGKIQIY